MPDKIANFFSFIDKKKQQIDNDIAKGHNPSILLLCLLDTLSLYAFSTETDSRKRFIRLIDTYSDWVDKNRISLIQLQCLLDRIRIPSAKYDELCKEVGARISKWENGRINRSSEVDPLLDEFNKYRDGLTDRLISAARYPSLLWVMRNRLVHSFVMPGDGVDISDDKSTPYYIGGYHSIEALKKKDLSWGLVISPEVISSLMKSCADNLRAHFEKHSINPDERLPLTECWFSDRDIKSLRNLIEKRS